MTQTPPHPNPSITYVGVDGLLVRFGETVTEQNNQAALAFHRYVDGLDLQGVLESAPSLIAVYFRIDITECLAGVSAGIQAALDTQDWFALPSSKGRLWTIPCSFDGPQLAEAAELAGVTQTQAVDQITAARTRVLTLGFAPGQPYLGNLEEHWNIPRMSGIAPNVPAQALVIAVRQLIIFANAAPTGWRHIGQTAFRCFDQDRADPFAFKAGDHVRFRAVARAEIDALASDTFGGARLDESQ